MEIIVGTISGALRTGWALC